MVVPLPSATADSSSLSTDLSTDLGPTTMTPLPLTFGLEEEAAPHPVEPLTQQGCLHSGPQLQPLVVSSEDGLIPMSDLLVSFIAVGPAEGIS